MVTPLFISTHNRYRAENSFVLFWFSIHLRKMHGPDQVRRFFNNCMCIYIAYYKQKLITSCILLLQKDNLFLNSPASSLVYSCLAENICIHQPKIIVQHTENATRWLERIGVDLYCNTNVNGTDHCRCRHYCNYLTLMLLVCGR